MTAWGWVGLTIGILALIVVCAVTLLVRIATARYVFGRRNAEKGARKQRSTPTPWTPYEEKMNAEAAWFMAQKPQPAEITSYDGLKLKGLYLPHENSKQSILLMHGYRSRGGIYDFANLLRFYHESGLNILVVDQRAHGASEGRHICYGVKERHDCKQWLEWLDRQHAPQDMFLAGLSMGAATVLMTAALSLPHNLRCIIADCGYTSPWDICSHVVQINYHLPAWLIMPAANLGVRLYAGFSLKQASALDAMRADSKLPVLFIHGQCDTFVPTAMGQANFEACQAPKRLLLVPQAGHALSAWLDPKGVQAAITQAIKDYGTV